MTSEFVSGESRDWDTVIQEGIKRMEEEMMSYPEPLQIEVQFDELCQLAVSKGSQINNIWQRDDIEWRVAQICYPETGQSVFIYEDRANLSVNLLMPDLYLDTFKNIFIGGEGAMG